MDYRDKTSLNTAKKNKKEISRRHNKEQPIFKRYEEEILGERSLWRGVITQALMDAGSHSTKREARFDRAQAISWLSGKSRDFLTVCSLAEFDPNYIIEKTREALKRGCAWREEKMPKEKPMQNHKKEPLDNIQILNPHKSLARSRL